MGANIKAARENLNLPQRVVAEKLGIETESLSRIERGVALPSLSSLDRLAGILEVSLVQLLSGVSAELSSLVATVQEEMEPLDEADRLFIIDQLKVLSRKLVEKSK
ncbi:helix-turn-helix domain-containing protein [Chromobacterium violaceum]|uniref:helix-turn-helix domain-containing protein n=1 Tax=Chromobacterium violaceum TaxID=536 RepID=UPI00069AB4AF|nr:helix-turn-helix transcriptional regulator [Chromobacterium violaceum]